MRKIVIVTIFLFVILLSACKKPLDVSTMSLNKGQDTVEINSKWIDAGAIINIDDVDYDMELINTLDVSILGIQTMTYQYIFDKYTYTIDRKVIIVDQIKPVIELIPGVDTILVGEDWIDSSASVIDKSNLGAILYPKSKDFLDKPL